MTSHDAASHDNPCSVTRHHTMSPSLRSGEIRYADVPWPPGSSPGATTAAALMLPSSKKVGARIPMPSSGAATRDFRTLALK